MDHDALCPVGPLDAGFVVCICPALHQARESEREKIEVLLGNLYNAGWRAAVEKTAPVVDAARTWVERIVDPPNLWADAEDFALIEAVKALNE